MTKISSPPASISFQKEPMIDLSLATASTDVESTIHSYDDEQDFEYLNDESTRRALDPRWARWDEQSKTSDALPSITRRRRSVTDESDASNRDTSKCSTKIGERISKLTNSPTKSPRSPLAEFLHTANTQGLKSSPLTDHDDDLSLDDTIYTVEDEIEFMCVVMESTAM